MKFVESMKIPKESFFFIERRVLHGFVSYMSKYFENKRTDFERTNLLFNFAFMHENLF